MLNKELLIEHHIHYKEIDGYDETVWMTKSEHQLLHMKLREEGRCNTPVEKLAKISRAANQRTVKARGAQKKYRDDNREKMSKYLGSWNRANPDYKRKWQEENRDKVNAAAKRYRDRKKANRR